MDRKDLLDWRKKRGLTQRELGAILGMSKRTIVNWEQGDTALPDGVMERLSACEEAHPVKPALKYNRDQARTPPEQFSDIFCNVAMPGVEVPHGFPKQRVEWFERHCLRALAATYVPGIGMVDDKPDGFGPACSPWFYTRGFMPAFVRDNVEAIRAMQADGTTPEELLAELREMPRWNGKPEKTIKTA